VSHEKRAKKEIEAELALRILALEGIDAPSQLGADPELHIPRRRAARALRRERAQILDGNYKSGTTHISA